MGEGKMNVPSLIETVNEMEAADWEETTREERFWMQAFRALGLAFLEVQGRIEGLEK